MERALDRGIIAELQNLKGNYVSQSRRTEAGAVLTVGLSLVLEVLVECYMDVAPSSGSPSFQEPLALVSWPQMLLANSRFT